MASPDGSSTAVALPVPTTFPTAAVTRVAPGRPAAWKAPPLQYPTSGFAVQVARALTSMRWPPATEAIAAIDRLPPLAARVIVDGSREIDWIAPTTVTVFVAV